MRRWRRSGVWKGNLRGVSPCCSNNNSSFSNNNSSSSSNSTSNSCLIERERLVGEGPGGVGEEGVGVCKHCRENMSHVSVN